VHLVAAPSDTSWWPELTSRRLPRSLDPLADESLPGFLLRLAYRLGISPARLVTRTGLSMNMQHRIDKPFSLTMQLAPEARDAFARTARLTPRETTDLCLSSLADRYPLASTMPIRSPWTGHNRQNRWVFIKATRYCPQCLADDHTEIQRDLGGAWQKMWRLPPVFACITHRRFLDFQCPACSRPALDCAVGRSPVSMLPHWYHRGLHPTQCRVTVRDNDAPNARGPICGAELKNSRPKAPTISIPDSLVTLQRRILDILRPTGPNMATSVGRQTTPTCYFTDLRLMAHLVRASWPRARGLVSTPMLAEAIERHTEQEQRQLTSQRPDHAMFRRDVYDIPPLDPIPCAALLAIADRLLNCETPNALSRHLRDLLPYDTPSPGRAGWSRDFLETRPDCSEGLRQAVAPVLQTYVRDHPPRPLRAPIRKTRFGPQHIAQFLQDDWYERRFAHFDGISPMHLRRTAAIHLCQIAAGGSIKKAASLIGIPSTRKGLERAQASARCLHCWARKREDPKEFEAALHSLADELDAAPDLVDYQQRREALRNWCIDPDTWQQLLEQLPAPRRRNRPLELGDKRRQTASMIVWARITQGEHVFAPHPIRDQQPPDIQRA
jgi:TniQ